MKLVEICCELLPVRVPQMPQNASCGICGLVPISPHFPHLPLGDAEMRQGMRQRGLRNV